MPKDTNGCERITVKTLGEELRLYCRAYRVRAPEDCGSYHRTVQVISEEAKRLFPLAGGCGLVGIRDLYNSFISLTSSPPNWY